ncbi:MAG: two-component system sensor histidine kinase NtrB [Hyphomicrobiaceae bacterium]
MVIESAQMEVEIASPEPGLAVEVSGLNDVSSGIDAVEKHALRAQLLDQVGAVHETDANGKLISVNVKMCAKTGYSQDELLSMGHHAFSPELESGTSWIDLHKPTTRDGLRNGVTLNRTADGSDLWLSTTIAPMHDANGQIIGYLCVSLDVTESQKLREEFQRNGKLMQLGQLIATVAHEIRNPLGAIRTAKFVLDRKLDGKVEGVEPQLERINNGIRRCDKIITELLDFSRKKVLSTTDVEIDSWLKATVDEERENLAGGPEVVCHCNLSGITAAIDSDQIRQVLINLLSNAAEAADEKTKAKVTPNYKARIDITTKLVGEHIHIEIADNGPGIEPKNLARIREPLFTTKSFGVGLGIPAIEKILEVHGGELGIDSEFGEGTTMTAIFHQGSK